MFGNGWGTGSYDYGYGSNSSQGLGFFERLKMQRRQRKEALKQQKLQQKEQMRVMKQQNKFQRLATKKGLNSGGFGGYGRGFGSGYDYNGYGHYGVSGYSGYQDTYRQQRGFLGGFFRRRDRQEEYYGDEYDNYPQNQVRTQKRRRQADYESGEEVPKSATATVAEKIASIGEKGKSALKKQQPVKVIDLAYDGCVKSGDYISAVCEVVERC